MQAKFVSSDMLANNAMGQGQLTFKKPSLLCLRTTPVDIGTPWARSWLGGSGGGPGVEPGPVIPRPTGAEVVYR